MVAFIEISLLIAILAFLVLQSKGGLGDLLGRKRKIILDSCALIDGRVVELARNGFMAAVSIAFQLQNHVHHMLQDLGAGNRAFFGNVAHQNYCHAALLCCVQDKLRAIGDLRHTSCR